MTTTTEAPAELREMELDVLHQLPDQEYNALFKKGRKFKVVAEGCRIWGMKPSGPWSQTGYGQDLNPGEIYTCRGSSMTFGDGVPAIKWADEDDEWICNDATFQPENSSSMWAGVYPLRGTMLPLYGPDEEIPEPSKLRVIPSLQDQLDKIGPKPGQTYGVWVISNSDSPPERVGCRIESNGGIPATLLNVVNFDTEVTYPLNAGCDKCGIADVEEGQEFCSACIEMALDEDHPDRAHIKRVWEAAQRQLGMEGEPYKELDASLRRISDLLEHGKEIKIA